MVYDYITWAKGKSLRFIIANLDEATVKKVVWGTDNSEIMSEPVAEENSMIVANADTLQEGTTKVIASVTLKDGTVKEYSTNVRVSNPKINTTELDVFKTVNASDQWQRYISFTGLNKYSEVTWSQYESKYISCTPQGSALEIVGVKKGNGTIKATVDGKTFIINYKVYLPKFSVPTKVQKPKKNKKVIISGIDGVTPTYSSRNKKIVLAEADGTLTTKKAGVTYVDVQLGNITYTFRMEVAAKGMKTIIKRAKYIVNHWTYSQGKRLFDGYYDCSALVWKGYKAYKNYQKKLSNINWPLSAGALFDYLDSKGQIVYYGYLGIDNMKPGDLIFYGDYNNAVIYSTPGRTLDIYHVSMYAGNGEIVEKGGRTITYNNIKNIVGIGRVVK